MNAIIEIGVLSVLSIAPGLNYELVALTFDALFEFWYRIRIQKYIVHELREKKLHRVRKVKI